VQSQNKARTLSWPAGDQWGGATGERLDRGPNGTGSTQGPTHIFAQGISLALGLFMNRGHNPTGGPQQEQEQEDTEG
jgi:hypothetical protein